MICNRMAKIDYEELAAFRVEINGFGHRLDEVKPNCMKTLKQYLEQEGKTQSALSTIMQYLESDMINDETKIRMTKELIEWTLR